MVCAEIPQDLLKNPHQHIWRSTISRLTIHDSGLSLLLNDNHRRRISGPMMRLLITQILCRYRRLELTPYPLGWKRSQVESITTQILCKQQVSGSNPRKRQDVWKTHPRPFCLAGEEYWRGHCSRAIPGEEVIPRQKMQGWATIGAKRGSDKCIQELQLVASHTGRDGLKANGVACIVDLVLRLIPLKEKIPERSPTNNN